MRIKALAILLFFIVLAACEPNPAEIPPTETPVILRGNLKEIPLDVGYGVDGGWFELYFTDPSHPEADSLRGGPDRQLAAAIDDARLSVDLAVYSFSLWSIRDALIDAHHRGVQVRIVMESDNRDRDVPQDLIEAGIPIIGDRREGLMHDKFVIIDRSELWVGSMNFTIGGGYEDNNNLLRIHSVKLAENYQKEFDEMYVDDHFGPDTVSDTPNPSIKVEGTTIETYFSPDDGVADVIIDLLDEAEESIYFMAFSFTSDDISDAIQRRAQGGVIVAGVFDESQTRSNQGGEYDSLLQAGLNVRQDNIDGLMHHKVFIIDQRIVITGSYNFSRSAEERNDENILVIHNIAIAREFLMEFERVSGEEIPTLREPSTDPESTPTPAGYEKNLRVVPFGAIWC
ncbi:MAG: phospholipase [Anaerolineales bacterium]|uniref:phospholipase D n=1 Tax=Candidatus Desulfolinea nitratireducens TaxID=2841698 RepID=A0A8J6NLB2_9CHLR|nr:phospholipase [Candidatus Desulfolinea nitratireducens]MBL6960837.1 phospholipase [Anaerolineales bacterium]